MNLLLDLGNTRLKAARMDATGVGQVHGFALASTDFAAQFSEWLKREVPDATPAWLAAVAVDAQVARVEALLQARGLSLQRVCTRPDALGVRVAYADASRLGVDRWLGLIAAHAQAVDTDVLIASVGSALTIDALRGDGVHLGGLIAPPPEAMRAALVARAPRLDVDAGQVRRFATSTEDAISSGSVLAAAALIERSLAELDSLASRPAQLWLTGGGAQALRAWLPEHRFVPHLVLDGLAVWISNPTLRHGESTASSPCSDQGG